MQDEIARKIAEALRIKLSPQEQEALAAKPTENLQAYDLYLRGKSYARRLTRQDLEFALQMFENAVGARPRLRPRPRRDRQRLRPVPLPLRAGARAGSAARCRPPRRRAPSGPTCPRCMVAEAWILYAEGQYDQAVSAGAPGDRAEARHRGRLLPPAARALRLRAVPGGRAPRRRGARGERRGLQRVRAHHERAGRAGQEGRPRQDAPAGDPGARDAPPDGAGGRAGPHPPGRRLREPGPGRGAPSARRASRSRCAPTRRSSSTTRPASSASSARRPRPWRRSRRPGTPASATPTGRGATPTSPSSTATPSSRRLYPAGSGEGRA